MKETRCPMCGKPNPAELAVCQFCKARLKPLIGSPSDGEGGSILSRPRSQTPEDEGSSIPDWIRGLQSSTAGESEEDYALPDWMEDAPDAFEQTGDDAEESAEDSSLDWLSRISDQDSGDARASTPAFDQSDADDSDTPAWLQQMRAEQQEEQEQPDATWDFASEESGLDTPAGTEGALDWFASADFRSQPPGPAPSTEVDDSDWFASTGLGSPGEGDSPAPGAQPEDLPDWFAESAESTGAESQETGSTPNAETEDTGWFALADFDSSSEEDQPSQGTQSAGIEDWFASAESSVADEPGQAPTGAGAHEGLPDWMISSGLGSLGEEAPISPQPADPPGDAFDWFSETAQRPAPIPAVEQPADEFDWFAEADLKSQVDPDDSPDSVLDWLASTDQPGEDEEPETPAQAGALRDWFAAAGFESSEEQDEVSEQSVLPEEDIPDWLAPAQNLESDPGRPSAPAFFDQEDEDQDSEPDWLADLEASSDPILPAEQQSNLFMEDDHTESWPAEELEEADLAALPKWINQVSADETEGEDEAALDRAELPGWLEAMRPVEAIVPGAAAVDREGPVEKAGPLAGLQSVLPAQSEFSDIKKPPAYSVKLQVTETQQLHAGLMENLLASEDEPRPVQARREIPSQLLLRLGVAVFLIASILVGRSLFPGLAPLPLPYENEGVVQAAQAVDSLMVGAPVLLAVDYEPGFSGELDTAASGLVGQIISRGGRLVLVSTLPDGAVNAERFLAQLERQRGEAIGGYVNLGFVTGGAAGLRAFAETPRQVFPYTLDTLRVWDSHPFDTIESAADFHLVVVVTENPVTARAWIEQVQPIMQDNYVPLLMVVSAQTEPLVRPYFDAFPRQVAGLVAGIAGGTAYESQVGRAGSAVSTWDSFSIGLFVGAVLLALGGLVSSITPLFSRPKESEVEENV